MIKVLGFISSIQISALALAGAAHAESPPLPPGARARLLLAADQALRDGRIAEARDAHLALWDATGEQAHACNAGSLSFRMHDMPRAVELLGLCVAKASPADPDTKDARIELAQARMLVAELHVRGPDGTEVLIDGNRRGEVPLTIYVWPGSYVVTGKRADDEEGSAGVKAAAGEAHRIDLVLERPASRPNGWIIAGGAVTSAGLLGLGAGLLISSDNLERKGSKQIANANGCFDVTKPGCRDAEATIEPIPTMRALSTGALIAGAALATTTLVYTFVPRSRVPVSTRVGAGFVSVEGRW